MKTSVKHLSDTKVIVTVLLGEEELQAAKQVALTKLGKEVKVPGFRKGKVPVSVVAKHVDPNTLAQQTIDDALSRSVAEAFLANDLQALDRPAVEIKKFVPDQELEFTAEVEILPKATLGDYKKLKLVREKASVSKVEVDEIIERIRKGLAEKKPVKREAKDGDEVLIDFIGKKNDVAFENGSSKNYELLLGSGSFIPGFEEQIVGHKSGEEFDIDVVFPKDYHAADLKGQKVVFAITLKEVREILLPEVDDAFAKKAGPFETAEELKKDIKRELLAQKEREADEKLKDEAVKQLVAVSKIEAPEVLVNDQAQSIEQDMTQNLAYRGMTIDQYIESKKYKDKDEWVKKEVLPVAKDRVKAGLLLSELSKVEKIEATSEELAERLNTMKQQYTNNPEMLKQLDDTSVQRDVANRLLTEKTVERLIKLNTK